MIGLDDLVPHSRSNNLRRVQSENCGLTAHSGAFTSGGMFLSSSCLQHLNLSCNNLSGLEDWSWASRLHSLKLASCQLNDVDLECWISLLRLHNQQPLDNKVNTRHHRLRQLDLQHNQISHSGTIAQLLIHHPQLQSMNLQFNPLGSSNNKTDLSPIVEAIQDHQYSLTRMELIHPFSIWKPNLNFDSLSPPNVGRDQDLLHWLMMNQAGRGTFFKPATTGHVSDDDRTQELLEQLERADLVYGLNALYFFLREAPHWIALLGESNRQIFPRTH